MEKNYEEIGRLIVEALNASFDDKFTAGSGTLIVTMRDHRRQIVAIEPFGEEKVRCQIDMRAK